MFNVASGVGAFSQIQPPTGGNNRILLKSEEKVVMYDLTARKTVDELSIAGGVRYVVWSQNGAYVAFMSKHNVLLAGKNLEYYHSFHENIRVKSGAWDENGVFIYSTWIGSTRFTNSASIARSICSSWLSTRGTSTM